MKLISTTCTVTPKAHNRLKRLYACYKQQCEQAGRTPAPQAEWAGFLLETELVRLDKLMGKPGRANKTGSVAWCENEYWEQDDIPF